MSDLIEDTPYNRALRKQMDDEAEALRVQRWWDTYNAALTGLYARRSDPKDPRHHEIDIDARCAAGIAHGALEKAP